MPELPEVETVVRGLRQHVAGRTVISVRVMWDKAIQSSDPATFVAAVTGRRVVGVGRRGKYVILDMDNLTYLSIHLRMTGRLFLAPLGAAAGKHTRAAWTLDNGHELHFDDPRKFGRIALLDASGLAMLDNKLGPEPLDGLTADLLATALRRRRVAIKSALLDQAVLAGVGNIYADEALFQAGVHPQRAASSLTSEEIARLHHAIRGVLTAAIDRHGTTLRDEQFKGLEGRMGENQGYLGVFGRTGLPCPRCGDPVQRSRLGGRSTHFCPRCQT